MKIKLTIILNWLQQARHYMRQRLLLIWIILFTALVFFSINKVYSLVDSIANARTENCQRTNSLMHLYVFTNDNKVGKPGSALYDYYKDHPDAVKLAHAQNSYFLRQFDAKKCK